MIGIQFRERRHLVRIVAMMRHGMVCLRQPNLGIRAVDILTRHQERTDPSDIRLERQHL